jgi:hypothetical protein
MSEPTPHTPEWVRRQDGSQVPFDADRICQSLFAAAEALGTPNAFLARELTDAVVHFLAQEPFDPIPTTHQIAEHVEKIAAQMGHPALARRYGELQRVSAPAPASAGPARLTIPLHPGDSPQALVERTLQSYSLNVLCSSDLRAAHEEGLLRLAGLASPETLLRAVVDAQSLGTPSWWIAWEPWQACAASWVLDSPEWLAILLGDRVPTVSLCERIVALPRAGRHPVELHLNVAVPPHWVHSQGVGPLFAGEDNPFRESHRFGFLDMLLEQALLAEEGCAPAIAWHLGADSFADPAQLGRLKLLARHALAGKAIRFVFDRPAADIALAEGLDRGCPGLLEEVGLDLAAFARRPEVASDGATFLQKLPSLARMATSAIDQKRRHLRRLPEANPLRRGFLIERSAGLVTPVGLDEAVRRITGEAIGKSPLSLDFALKVLSTLREALQQAGRAVNLDVSLDLTTGEPLEVAARLHALAGAGMAVVTLSESDQSRLDSLVEMLHQTLLSTTITRLRLRREDAIAQGELSI